MVVLAKGASLSLDDLPSNIKNFDLENNLIIDKSTPILDTLLTNSTGESFNEKTFINDVVKEPATLKVKTDLKKQEMDIILKTLEECGGNRTKAAEVLGISRRTLQRKLSGK